MSPPRTKTAIAAAPAPSGVADPRKFVNALRRLDGAVVTRSDPFANVLRWSSPSLNYVFGKAHGLPRGYSILLWGPPKAGKSVLCFDAAGQVLANDPTAIVVKFDTEFRDEGQLTEAEAACYGIDLNRFVVFSVSDPALVFDRVVDEIVPMINAGANIPLIIIDSITGVQGRGAAESDKGVKGYHIGDHAVTTAQGLKAILPFQRPPGAPPEKKISLIMTAHASSEFDRTEQMRGNKTKVSAAFGVKHHCEYFINIEPDATKEGKKDAKGNELIDESRSDMKDKAEQTAHGVWVWMHDSTMGPVNRRGRFTYSRRLPNFGIVNQHEEVYRLGEKWGVISRAPNGVHTFNGAELGKSKDKTLDTLAAAPEIQKAIIAAVRRIDAENKIGEISDADVEAEVASVASAT